MALFEKKEVIVLKEPDSVQPQIEELQALSQKAEGKLKDDIGAYIDKLKKGASGEDEIMFQLKYSDMDLIVIRDLYLVFDDLTAQIDYYIVTPWIDFVVECKNLYGNITVNNKGDFIRSYQYGGKTVKEGIPSPITQNERHLLVLKNLRLANAGKLSQAVIERTFGDFTKSLVVLSNSRTVLNDRYAPAAIRKQILRADSIVNVMKTYIRASKEAKISKKQMMAHAQSILSLHRETRTDYVARYRALVEQQLADRTATSDEPRDDLPENEDAHNEWVCPQCGKQLVKRKGKTGVFIGCSGYPQCRYTRNYYSKKENKNG